MALARCLPFAFADCGIAGGIHSGSAAESIYLQSGVVSETVISVVLLHVASLLHGVFLQRLVSLGQFLVAVDVVERQHFVFPCQYLSHLTELVFVICGKNKFLCHISFLLRCVL